MAYTSEAAVSHEGLNKYRVIRGHSDYEVQQKVKAQIAAWDEQWARKLAADKTRMDKARISNEIERNKISADLQSKSIEQAQRKAETILSDTLNLPLSTWDFKKQDFRFTAKPPSKPILHAIPDAPERTSSAFNPTPPLMYKLSKKKMSAFNLSNDQIYEQAYKDWEDKRESITELNKTTIDKYQESLTWWEEDKALFYDDQKAINTEIDRMSTPVYF